VICNLQKTPFDVDAKIKLQGTTDEVMALLLEELQIGALSSELQQGEQSTKT